jgi:predicted transcriptional regulator
MSFPRRAPTAIALELLDCIDEKGGRATKWDLIKIVGNEAQFQQWIKGFLHKERFIEEIREANHFFYKKTESGELFHKLLKNGKVVRALLRVSGKRLRRTHG